MKKIIAIALVLMLCVSALSVAAFAADTVTVTAEVPAGWTTAYCYYWGGASVSWPGVQMTKSGNTWTAKIPADSANIIITAGASGPQTVDLAVEVGKDLHVVLGAMSGGKYTASVNGTAPEAPVSDGYYVTGSDVFGNWAEKNAAGKMTEKNGLFVKEFTGVPAGSYSLKVNDGTWANSWGGNGENGNYDFEVAAANSTVTVTFNPADYTVTVEVNGSNAGGEVTPPPATTFDAYYVAGTSDLCNGIEWDPGAEANKMTKGDDGIWTITFNNVPAGEHKLKVTAGNWDNCWGAVEGGDADGNVVITLEEAAEKIVVKFNPTTNVVSVYNGENPVTNDVSMAGVAVALLAATAGVVALVGMKKKEN